MLNLNIFHKTEKPQISEATVKSGDVVTVERDGDIWTATVYGWRDDPYCIIGTPERVLYVGGYNWLTSEAGVNTFADYVYANEVVEVQS